MTQQYKPTQWIGGKTVGTADIMNNIEQGIESAHQRVDEVGSELATIANKEYFINVHDYNVVGDGVTDDSIELQKVFNNSNCTIKFKPKIYIISKGLDIVGENIIIDGNGSTIRCSNSHGINLRKTSKNITIKNFNFDFEYIEGFSNACITTEKKNAQCGMFDSVSGVKIENCSFNGSVFGVVLNSSTNVNIKDCTFKNHYFVNSDGAGGYGVLIQSSYNVNIENCLNISGLTNRHFVYISVDRTKTVNIENKNINIENNFIDFSNNVGVTGAESAIVIRESNNVNVVNNTINDSFGGLYINANFNNVGVKNVTIENNKFYSIRENTQKMSRSCLGLVGNYPISNLKIINNSFDNVNISQAINLKNCENITLKNNAYNMNNSYSKVFNFEGVVNFISDSEIVKGNRSHNFYYIGTVSKGRIVNFTKDNIMQITEFSSGNIKCNTTRDIQRMIKVYRDFDLLNSELKLNYEGLVNKVTFQPYGFDVSFNNINVYNLLFTFMQTFGELSGLSIRSVNTSTNSVSFNVVNAVNTTKTGQWNIYF